MGTGEGPPPARREISASWLRWLDGEDDDDEEYVQEEEEELGTGEAPPPSREISASRRRWLDGEDDEEEELGAEEAPSPPPQPPRRKITASRRRWLDGEDDDEEEYVQEDEEEDLVEELSASSAGEEGEGSDAEYQEDEEEEEEEIETPRPKRPVKSSDRGRKRKVDPAAARSRRQKYEEDEDYEEEAEEEEEYHDEIEEVDEEEQAPPRPKSLAKCGGRSRNVKSSTPAKRSHQRRHVDEDDMDFDPELDEEEDELDEDVDFDPEVDDDDEDEYQDEEEEEPATIRSRKVTVKNTAKRKSASKRRSLTKKKKKKKSKGSKVSGKKSSSGKAKKSAPVRRRRKRSVVDKYEDDEDEDEDDDDFIVEDEHPRKKARTRSGREAEVDAEVSPAEEETWPNLESDTSDFEFATSDEEPNNVDTPAVEQTTVRKGRKKRTSGSESSSDSEFVVSDKELEDLKEADLPKPVPMLPAIRRICITRHGEGKGKEKQEPEEAGKPICGICLSEEQRATVQGVLNCCSHYFCFACIMEWSRVESRCPLCKQRFTTITKSSKVDLGLGVRKAVIKVEERDQVYQPTEEEIRRWLDPYENVVCIECNQGGDDSLMLLCDICDSSAHTYCVGLGREVPEGNWYCGGCRLGDEGPSYTGIQRTVAYERQNYRNQIDNSSVSFGPAAPTSTFERPPSINPRRSFQGIDLNLSPREFPGESHPAESQVSTDGPSTPTGRRATLSGRRQIHRYIRILLTRPRPPSRSDPYHSIAQHSGGVPGTEPNRRNFPSSSEANTSRSLPDNIQNNHSGLPFVQAHSNFAPCMSLDGDDFQQIEGVKSNLRNL
ncbi:unnamed protein product [Urochloa decumbens]|uniref:PHD and RING finger domain-containing protein 1 n=2 Tax=Urochloa decumbens TaxID=240449 RepID=A0ABC8X9R4_9POAL